MALEYKRVPFSVKATGSAESGWEIAGLASTWWGEPDSYGDVVQPGAFAASIASRATKFLYEHREPIGKQLELKETDEGLWGRWSVVPTRAGTDAHLLAEAGVLDSLSIGYIPLEWEHRPDGVRVLQKVDLFEVSAVAIPANVNAVVTDVKLALSERSESNGGDEKAVWSAATVNGFPDSSFALILPGGEKDSEGKTTPRSLRKLPHHDGAGNLDAPHVRNGLARAPQMTGVSDAQRARAVAHLERHLAALNKAAEHEAPEPALDLGHELRRRRLAAHGIVVGD